MEIMKLKTGEEIYKINIPDNKRVMIHYTCEPPKSLFVMGFEKTETENTLNLVVKEYIEKEQ